MPVIEALRSLNRNPQFQELDYEEQKKLRFVTFQEALQTDIQFQQQPPQVVSALGQALVNGPPALREDQLSEEGREWLQMGTQFQTGNADDQTRSRAGGAIALNNFARGNGIFGFAVRAGNKLLGQGEEIEGTELAQGGTADDKALQYLREQFSGDTDTEWWRRALTGSAYLGGLATSIMGGRTATQAGLGAARNLGKLKSLTQSGFGTWLYGRAVPEAVESGIDSAALTIGDVLNNRQGERLPEWLQAPDSPILQTALNFGQNFVEDMVFFAGLNLLTGMGKQVATTFRRGGPLRDVNQVAADLTPTQFNEIRDHAFGGNQMGKGTFNSLPSTTQDAVVETRRIIEHGRNFENLTPQESAEFLLFSKGKKLQTAEDGSFYITDLNGHQIEGLGNFAEPEDAVARLAEVETQPISPEQGMFNAIHRNEFSVKQQLRQNITEDSLRGANSDTVASAFTPSRTGELNTEAVREASRSILRSSGKRVDNIKVNRIDADRYFDESRRGVRTGGDNTINIPSRLRTPEEMEAFLKRYETELTRFPDIPETAGIGSAGLKRNIDYIGDVQKKNPRSPATSMAVESIAAKYNLPVQRIGDRVRVGNSTFDSAQDALNYVYRQDLLRTGLPEVQEAFGRQFGLKIEQLDDGSFTAKQSKGQIISTGSNLELLTTDLMNKGFTPRPGQHLASTVVIDPDTTELVFEQGVVRGPWKRVEDYIKEFGENKRLGQWKTLSDTDAGVIKRDSARTVFRVESPKMGVLGQEFTDFKEAKDFIRKGLDDRANLKKAALYKGVVNIEPVGNDYLVSVVGETKPRIFTSYEDVKKFIETKEAPAEWSKELSNINQEYIDTAIENIDDPQLRKVFLRYGSPKPFRAGDFTDHIRKAYYGGETGKGLPHRTTKAAEAKTFSMRDNFARVITNFKRMGAPRYTTMRRISAEEGTDHLASLFERMDKANYNARGEFRRVGQILTAVRNTPGVDAARRTDLMPFLQKEPAVWDELQESTGIKLTGNDKEYLRRYRSTMERLGTYFNIDPYKMLQAYLPRFKRDLADLDKYKEAIAHPFAEDAIKSLRSFGNTFPREVQFFSRNLRTRDLVQFIEEADPQEILERYVTQGVKNITLGETFNEVRQAMSDLTRAKVMGVREVKALAHYLEEMMGMYADETSQIVQEISQGMSDTLTDILNKNVKGSKLPKPVMRNFIGVLQGWTVAATMSFKPWLPVRNLQQVFTTLAGHFGNRRIMDALKKVQNESELRKTAERLWNSGRLQSKASEMNFIMGSNTGWLSKYNAFGMKWYQNSDHLDRIIVDMVVDDAFTTAAAKYQAGIINEKQFLDMSEMDRLDDFDQRRILQALETEGVEVARDYYGDFITRQTMFAYTHGSNPAMFKGVWGNLFGQFGHYPIYYMENLINGVTKGPLHKRAQFISTVAFNSAALWFVFEKFMGIRSDSFLPHKTMFFSGGPYFQMVVDTLAKASGEYDAKGWDQIAEDASRLFVPGMAQFRAVAEGIKYAKEGDTYRSLLSFMSVPDAPDGPMSF